MLRVVPVSCLFLVFSCGKPATPADAEKGMVVHKPGISGNCSMTDEDGDFVRMVQCSEYDDFGRPLPRPDADAGTAR